MYDEVKQADHDEFIHRTDRKSLHSQIKALVLKAQEVANEELNERSQRLKVLLEREDSIYEEEFANKVKTRIDEDIRERKDALHAIMKSNLDSQQNFVDEKRIQQVMENCYEIRQALRAEDLRNVKLCQEEQILENLRKKQRECEVDKFWQDVENKRWADFDKKEERERCLREYMNNQMRHVLEVQLKEVEERREREQLEKLEEAKALDKLLDEMRKERIDAELHRNVSPKMEGYREELLQEIEAHRIAREAEAEALKQEHLAFIRETQRLEAEERQRLAEEKRLANEANREYMAYARRMKNLEAGIEKMLNDRIDDLNHVDMCTKSNLAEAARIRAENTAKNTAILKQQICEEAERRMRDDAEHRSDKMLENRFASPEKPRASIMAQRLQQRADLDRQIIELKRIRQEEEEMYEKKLLKATDDPEICHQLAKQYLSAGIDYLKPHPNWRIIACGKEKAKVISQQLAAQPTAPPDAPPPSEPRVSEQLLQLDIPPEGAKKREFRSCHCPPGTRRHNNLLMARGAV